MVFLKSFFFSSFIKKSDGEMSAVRALPAQRSFHLFFPALAQHIVPVRVSLQGARVGRG